MIVVGVLIFFGALLAMGSLVAAYWLAALACVMQTTGCVESGIILFLDIMTAPIGLPFWGAFILGGFMIWWGFRIKSHHLTRKL